MSEAHRLAIPAELEGFTHEPCLLPRESRREFETIRRMIIDDIRPKTNIEWLWTLDLVELSWEIHRYRCLKKDPRRISHGCGRVDSAATDGRVIPRLLRGDVVVGDGKGKGDVIGHFGHRTTWP